MHRLFMFAAILLINIFALSPLRAAAPDWAAIDAMIAPYQEVDAPGISLAVSIDGEIVYQRWAGQANLAHNVPIDVETRFEIASISKQFTAFAIMMLVDEGKLTLDQNVRDIFPEMQIRSTPITIRHLLNHTSGLREANSLLQLTGAFESSPVLQFRSLDLILRQRGENFPAGERQEYSNTGYELLAEIVSRTSGIPFPEFMRSRIFEPLGMDQTFVRSDPEQIVRDLASGYQPAENGFAQSNLLASSYGASGIVSNPSDLLIWAHALETGALGGPAVVEALAARSALSNGRRAIGSNGQEYRDFRGLDTWSHGGSIGGFRGFLLRIPEQRMAIAVISNRADFLKAAFAFDVAEILLGDRLAPVAAEDFVPESGTELDRYVGDYRLFGGIVFSLRRDGDHLTFARFGNGDASRLPQIGKGVFMLDPKRELRLEFHDFVGGQAAEMRWQVSDDGFIPAPRIHLQPVPQTALDMDELTGTYYSDTLQQAVTLYKDNNTLWLRSGDGTRVSLVRYQIDTFRSDGPGSVSRVEIQRGAGGSVLGLFISAALADKLEFRRIDTDKAVNPPS